MASSASNTFDASQLNSNSIKSINPSQSHWLIDICIVIAIIATWQVILWNDVTNIMPVGDDTFRDSAYVHNILEGYILQDPSMRGFDWWYMPGGGLFFAGICKITGWAPLEAYSYSILWLNVWLGVLFYLLVRMYTDRTIGICALVACGLGCMWWQTHATMPISSIHGVNLALLSLIIWRKTLRHGGAWIAFLGITLAVCAWHHLISAIIACGAIGFHGWFWRISTNEFIGKQVFRRALLTGIVCGVLVSPAVIHLLLIPKNNPNFRYVGSEMLNPDFALHIEAPLFWVFAIGGGFLVFRSRQQELWWIFGVITIGAIGQSFGLLRRYVASWVPSVLPHEFQWHMQIGLSVLVGIGIVHFSRWVVFRYRHQPSQIVTTLVTFLLLTLLAVPDGLNALRRYKQFWTSGKATDEVSPIVQWVRENTHINDVIIGNYLPAYYDIAGRTGRKLVLMPEGRANIAANVSTRRGDVARMETTKDRDKWYRLAVEKYDGRYVYLTDHHEGYRRRLLDWGVVEPILTSPNDTRHLLRIIRPEE